MVHKNMKVRITKEMQAKKRNLSLLCINKIQISVCLVATSKSKKVLQYLSHQILRYVHGSLNVDEKKLIAQFGWKLRDERFEPN